METETKVSKTKKGAWKVTFMGKEKPEVKIIVAKDLYTLVKHYRDAVSAEFLAPGEYLVTADDFQGVVGIENVPLEVIPLECIPELPKGVEQVANEINQKNAEEGSKRGTKV